MKKAIANHEDFAERVVCIGGCTNSFVKLSPGMQQEVLLRTHYASV